MREPVPGPRKRFARMPLRPAGRHSSAPRPDGPKRRDACTSGDAMTAAGFRLERCG